jgi:hypothetical protein
MVKQKMIILLAPFVPWFLALMFELWPSGGDPYFQNALASLAHTCAYFGLGMLAANGLWAMFLNADTCCSSIARKEP